MHIIIILLINEVLGLVCLHNNILIIGAQLFLMIVSHTQIQFQLSTIHNTLNTVIILLIITVTDFML